MGGDLEVKTYPGDAEAARQEAAIREEAQQEKVNHPNHYGGDTVYEAIKVIEAWGLDFHLGNTVKYISRAGKKDDIVQDLKKAAWYLQRKIDQLDTDRGG